MSTSIFRTDETVMITKPYVTTDKNPKLKLVIKGSGTQISNNSSSVFKGFITSISQAAAARVEWSYTLGTNIFAYVFGDSLWDITVQGSGYIPCDNSGKTGYEEVVAFYENNNIAKEGKYCDVLIGSDSYRAYLVSGDIGTYQDATLGLFPFTFKFMAIKV